MAANAHPAARRLWVRLARALMAWCEMNQVDFVFGLFRPQCAAGRRDQRRTPAGRGGEASATGNRPPATSRTSAMRRSTAGRAGCRVVAKAEWTNGEANPRFIVTSLGSQGRDERPLSLVRRLYCARGEHGEPDQGMPRRPVRRPNLERNLVRQPAAALARLVRLCAPVRGQAHRSCPHPVRRS